MYKNPFDDLFQDTLKVVSPSPLGMLPDFTSVTNSMLKQSELTCKGITKLAEQSIGANLLEAAKSAEAAIGCAFRSLERQSRDVSQILEGMAGSYKIDAAQIIFEAQRTVFHNNIEIVRGFAESLCFEPLVLPTPAVLPIHHHREVPQDSQARTFIQDLIQLFRISYNNATRR